MKIDKICKAIVGSYEEMIIIRVNEPDPSELDLDCREGMIDIQIMPSLIHISLVKHSSYRFTRSTHISDILCGLLKWLLIALSSHQVLEVKQSRRLAKDAKYIIQAACSPRLASRRIL
jgi:hypothetical protein